MKTNTKTKSWYRLGFDDSNPDEAVIYATNFDPVSPWSICVGTPLEAWPNTATVFVRGRVITNYMVCGTSFVASEPLRLALEACLIEGIQFLPVAVSSDEHGRLEGEFWLANVLRTADALDWMGSHWMPHANMADNHPLQFVIKPALRTDVIKDLDLFVLKSREDLVGIYVSSLFRQCVEGAGVADGMGFTEVRS